MATGRFRGIEARFLAHDDLGSPLSGSDTRRLTSLTATSRMNGIGSFRATYPAPAPGEAVLGGIDAPGNIVYFPYDDWHYELVDGRMRVAGDVYIIENLEVSREGGKDMVTISGPSLLSELEGILAWEPIGDATTHNTTLSVAVPAPSTSTTTSAYSQGASEITLANASAFREEDMLIIPLSTGTDAFILAGGIDGNVVTLQAPLPGNVANGATITRRARLVIPAATDGMNAGAKITLTLNSGSHTTLIERGPEPDEDDVIGILVRDGITGAANVGKAVATVDKSTPTLNDVEQVIDVAEPYGWSNGGTTGFTNPSAHVPQGDSVYSLIETLSKIHSKAFVQYLAPTTHLPARTLTWGLSHSGSNPGSERIKFANVPQSLKSSYEGVENRGIIIGGVQHRTGGTRYTRVYPAAGDPSVTLFGVSALTIPLIDPHNIVNDAATLGLYTDPYVYDPGLEADGTVIGKAVTFSEVTAETKGFDAWTNACDMLAIRASAWLNENNAAYEEWRFSDVDYWSEAMLRPGERIDLDYYTDAGKLKSSYDVPENYDLLIVREVTVDWDFGKSRPVISLVASNFLFEPGNAGSNITASLRNYDKMVRRVGTGEATRSGAAYIGSAATSTSSPHSHSEYLSRSGGNLTGNLTLNAGLTVDGVDLSAHAANASAHHNPVTVGNAGLSLSTQVVSAVGDAARGISVGASGIGLDVSSTGALEFSSNQARVKLPTNSGLARDSTGLYLAPSTLTAATLNALSGSGHTHAITATATGVSTYDTLLKSGTAGELAVRFLGVGAAVSTVATAFIQSVNNDDYTLYLKQKSGQTADVWRVENSTGNALIRLTGGGDLESGTPGFTSGLTGWQVAADGSAEFNNVRVRGELHAATFVADEMHAVGGTLLVKTATTVAAPVNVGDNVLPAINSTFTLLASASYNTALNYLPNGSIIRIKPMGEIVSGGSLDLYDIYAEVVGVGSIAGRDLANGKPGYFSLSCVLRYGGTLGGSSGDATNFEIPAGSAIVLWTTTGASGYTGAIKLTNDGDVTDAATESPFMDVFTVSKKAASTSWAGVLPVIVPRVRVGNLRGVLGKSADEWGMAAGTDLSDTSVSARYIVASDAGLNLNNIDINLYRSGVQTVDISNTGTVYFGKDITSVATTGFFFDAASGNLRLGPEGAGLACVVWHNSLQELQIRDNTTPVITFAGSGNSYFNGRMTISTTGEIVQGSGTKGSVGTWSGTWGTFTGLRIGNDSGVGKLATYSSGVAQVYFDSTGQMFAGGGKTKLSANGIELEGYTLPASSQVNLHDSPTSIRFLSSSATKIGNISGQISSDGTEKSMSFNVSTGTVPRILLTTSYIGLHTGTSGIIDIGYSASAPDEIRFYGDIVQNSGTADFDFTGKTLTPAHVTASGTVNGNVVTSDTYLKADTGITVGVNVVNTPGDAVILMDGKASAASAPSGGTEVALYVVLSSGTYTLYMKKPDGTATAIASV